jgi:hypothetical protein
VRGIGVKAGENVPLNRGDFGDGEVPNPAFAIDVRLPELCDCSARLLFNDFARIVSDSGWVTMAAVEGTLVGSDKLGVKRGAAADTPPCSESMRIEFASLPIWSMVEWSEVGGNSK